MESLFLEPTELVNEQLDLEFEPGTFSIPEVLDSHLLPLVVQYDCAGQAVPFNKFHFDLTQPLLLYKKRNIQKVTASSLHIRDDRYEDLGESLLIPEDYKGWFAVLQRLTGSMRADDSVPHFASVEELASSNTEKFLIGGTKKISGLQILDRSEGQIKHEPRSFFPGDTLNIEKVEFGEAKKRTRLFRKTKYIREKFLLCTDESDRDILLPFDQQGIFYQVSHKSGKPMKNVMQMSDIVARKLTPRIIKLVFGRFPVTPCAFTGLMKAESSSIETSVIASTMVNKHNILMEIPVNNELFFRIAVTNDSLRQNDCYRNAMHFCAERASTYMRNIKICFNFTLRGKRCNDSPPAHVERTDGYVQLFNSPVDSSVTADTENAETSEVIPKIDSIPSLNVRHSDISETSEISLRPSRDTSTSRLSLCFGNSYLTVPLFDTCTEKRNSGNNNSGNEVIYTTKRGSRISFNGKFMELEGGAIPGEYESDQALIENYPPPMPCISTGSYVNSVIKTKTSHGEQVSDMQCVPGVRRHSSTPPDSAPPPIPLSSSTSGVSSGSLSSVGNGTDSNRASSDSCEYDVPKTDSSSSSCSSVSSRGTVTTRGNSSTDTSAAARVRRPSTYTFAEGCKPIGHTFAGMKGNLVEELEESSVDIDSPIYENIQSLMEICKKLDADCGHLETRDSMSSQMDITGQCEDLDHRVSLDILDEEKQSSSSVTTLQEVDMENDFSDPPSESIDTLHNYVKIETALCSALRLEEEEQIVAESEQNKIVQSETELCESNINQQQNDNQCQSDTGLKDIGVQADIGLMPSKSAVSPDIDDLDEARLTNTYVEDIVLDTQSQHTKPLTICPEVAVDKDSVQNNLCPSKEASFDLTPGQMDVPEYYENDSIQKHALNIEEDHNDTDCTDFTSRIHNLCDADTAYHAKDEQEKQIVFESNTTNTQTSCNDVDKITYRKREEDAKSVVSSTVGGVQNDHNQSDCAISNPDMVGESETTVSLRFPEVGEREGPDEMLRIVSEDSVSNLGAEEKENWQQAVRKLRKTRSLKADSSIPDPLHRAFPSDPDEVSRLSTVDVCEHFRAIGVRDMTLAQIEQLNIDGSVLGDILSGEKTVRESMAGVNLIDQQKISMYIRGWRPQSQ